MVAAGAGTLVSGGTTVPRLKRTRAAAGFEGKHLHRLLAGRACGLPPSKQRIQQVFLIALRHRPDSRLEPGWTGTANPSTSPGGVRFSD